MKISVSEMRQGIPAMGDVMKAADLGEMAGAFVTVPAGADLRPVLSQLEGGSCPVPHWGYVVSGALNIGYGSKTEVAKAGDLFWMEPGHVVWVDEDTQYVDFSPRDAMNDVLAKVDKIVAAG
ncbi:MAG: cupin domain-containing protein [Dehalococcoidia bacterium]